MCFVSWALWIVFHGGKECGRCRNDHLKKCPRRTGRSRISPQCFLAAPAYQEPRSPPPRSNYYSPQRRPRVRLCVIRAPRWTRSTLQAEFMNVRSIA